MASLIGALKVTLGLETAAFETGATRAAKRADALGNDVERLGNRVGTLTKVLGAAAIAAVGSQLFQTMSGLVKQGLEYASSLGEQAQQLGVTTKELQEYRYAASQAGIEQEAMDKSLAKLTLTIGKAATGAKGPAAAFKELGVSLRNADGSLLTAGEAFPKIAEGLAKIPDPAKRAKLEVELFGKTGQQLDTLLAGGAAGINNLRNAAHELGIVLSEKQIQDADEAADTFGKLKTVLSAQIAGVVADNAKEIAALAQALADLAGAAIKAAAGWAKLRNARGAADSQIERANAYLDGRKDLTPSARAQAKGMARKIIEQRNGVKTDESSYAGGLFKIKRTSLVPREPNANYAGAGLAPGGPFDGFAPSAWSGGLGEIDQISHAGIRPMGADAVTKVLRSMLVGMDAINERVVPTSGSVVRLRRDFEDMGKAAVNNTAAASAGAEKMKTSFEDSAQGIIGALGRVESSFQGGGFLDKLGAILGLGLQLKGLFWGDAAGAGAGHSGSNRLPGRWSGGPVMANRAYMVGERGPELFVPGSNGGIVPNGAYGQSGGGMRVEVVPSKYFDVRVQANIAQAAPQIARAGAIGGEARVIRRQSRRVM